MAPMAIFSRKLSSVLNDLGIGIGEKKGISAIIDTVA